MFLLDEQSYIGVEQSAWNLPNFRDDASTNQNNERNAWESPDLKPLLTSETAAVLFKPGFDHAY